MKRITPELLKEAKRMKSSWDATSKQVGKPIDEDFVLREIASLHDVSFKTLKRRMR